MQWRPPQDRNSHVAFVLPCLDRAAPTIGMWELARSLAREGFRITVVELSHGRTANCVDFASVGCEVVALGCDRKNLASSFMRFKRAIDRLNPVLIHSTGFRADLLTAAYKQLRRNTAIITTVRSKFQEEFSYGLPRYVAKGLTSLWLAALRRFDSVVPHSESLARNLRTLGYRAPVSVILNGVDCDRFRPPTAAEKLAAKRSLGLTAPFVVGYVGLETKH
jgi:glycosyltransferase involved in cell wall biosynthesis